MYSTFSKAFGLLLTSIVGVGVTTSARAIDGDVRALLETTAAMESPTAFETALSLAIRAHPEDAPDLIALAVELRTEGAERWQAMAPAATAADMPQQQASATPPPEELPTEVDAEPEEPAKPMGLFNLSAIDGNLNIGATVTTGDTEEKAFSLGTELSQIISENWDHELVLRGDYSRRQGVTAQEQVNGQHKLFYRGWNKLSLVNFFEGEYDRFSGFDYRLADSIGLGYTLIDTETQRWSVEAGPGVRFTAFDNSTETQTELIGRFASNYRWQLNANVLLTNKTNALVGTQRTTLANIAALESKLMANLAARFSFEVQYDSDVPVGTSEVDTQTSLKLIYDF